MSGRWIDAAEDISSVFMHKGDWRKVSIKNEKIIPDDDGDWVIIKFDRPSRRYYIVLSEVYDSIQQLAAIRNRERNVHQHKIKELDKEFEAIARMVIGKEYFE